MRRMLGNAQAMQASGITGATLAAVAGASGMVLLLLGAALQRAFDPAVIGALVLFLWPAWLLGAVLVVLGVAAFGVGVLSVAATAGLVLARRAGARA